MKKYNKYLNFNNDPRDPYYIPKETGYICCECREGIFVNDEYVQNENDECIHIDCIPSNTWLIKWFGYDIKKMEETYD